MTATQSEHADVRVPPPLIFGSVVAGGSLLGRTWPLTVTGDGLADARRVAGGTLVAGGVGLCGSALGRFRRAGTSPLPVRPSAALVVEGPYRFSRNPMYLGLTVGTAGVALLANNLWMLALLAPAVVVADRAVIRPEERYLERRFGDAYRAYGARVRRWL